MRMENCLVTIWPEVSDRPIVARIPEGVIRTAPKFTVQAPEPPGVRSLRWYSDVDLVYHKRSRPRSRLTSSLVTQVAGY